MENLDDRFKGHLRENVDDDKKSPVLEMNQPKIKPYYGKITDVEPYYIFGTYKNILKVEKSHIKKIMRFCEENNRKYFNKAGTEKQPEIDEKKVEEYKYYFLDFPLNLLKKNKDKKISFFYPSTEYINFDSKAPYSKIKAEAEDKIKKFCVRNNIKFIFHRFPAINSRQSVTILNSNNPSLNEYFNVNKKVVQKILLSN